MGQTKTKLFKEMKTIILFSSIFYLIGLKIGSTIEGVKHSLIPSKSIITAPLRKHDRSEKNYHFKSEEKDAQKEQNESHQGPESVKRSAYTDSLTRRKVG